MQDAIKRIFDIVASLLSLVVFGVPMLGIAVALKRTSPGPVLYESKRVGRNGKVFSLLKFRTMVVNADKIGPPSTTADDLRVTPIGKKLRRWKLDELPQLLNVFRGEMSMVGPRPEVPQEVALYTKEEMRVFDVKPGMTDLASLWNFHEEDVLRGSADPQATYRERIKPEKIRLQLVYVDHHSLWMDFIILLRTVGAVFRS